MRNKKGGEDLATKIYVSPSNQSGNIYYGEKTNEKNECKKIAKACVGYLKNNGFSVKCTYNNNMYERVKESNDFNADIHLAIHTNATAKHNVTGGTQILLYSLTGERLKLGKAVFERLAPFTPGKSAEKLIEKPSFYEINSAKGITVYCECEFHDTKEGAEFIVANTKEIGELIAKGICDYYGVSEKNENENNSNFIYKIQIGAFKNRNNAENYLKKAKSAGFDGFIVTEKN